MGAVGFWGWRGVPNPPGVVNLLSNVSSVGVGGVLGRDPVDIGVKLLRSGGGDKLIKFGVGSLIRGSFAGESIEVGRELEDGFGPHR